MRGLRRFFENCTRKGIPVRMTFDIGNWSWSDENVFEAAKALADYVVYLHCKKVEDRSARTGPISDDAKAAWRHVLAGVPAFHFVWQHPHQTDQSPHPVCHQGSQMIK